METDREMTERWVKEAEYAIKRKFKKIMFSIILVIILVMGAVFYLRNY